MKLTGLEIAAFTIGLVYWLYLLSPFQRNFTKRNYKKLLNNVDFFVLHLAVSGLLFVVNFIFGQPFFTFYVPFLLILCIRFCNAIYQGLGDGRDFIFIMRDDLYKHNGWDLFFSICCLVLPLVFSIIVMGCRN